MGHRYTIVGGRGFIGSSLAGILRERGDDVRITAHTDELGDEQLGTVLYASGVAASGTTDTSYAFTSQYDGVRRILDAGRFASFVLCSSARVYANQPDTNERASLPVWPETGNDIYRISKIAGEAICLAHPDPNVRVARLSNVVGENIRSPLFLADVFRQAAQTGRVDVRTTPDSEKDYIAIADVCRFVIAIAAGAKERVYNVASGANITNGAIYDVLRAAGVNVVIAEGAASVRTPAIDVTRLATEFGPARERVLPALPSLFERFRALVPAAAP